MAPQYLKLSTGFTNRPLTADTLWVGGCLDPSACLEAVKKNPISSTRAQSLASEHLDVYHVAMHAFGFYVFLAVKLVLFRCEAVVDVSNAYQTSDLHKETECCNVVL
jgi:hypothetical protein